MADFWEVSGSEPETRLFFVKFVGGTTAVTKVFGGATTVTYISTGIVDIAFPTGVPGPFVGVFGHCFEATTASAVKGYTVVPGVFNTTTNKLRVNITGASEALVDLAALQWLSLTLMFKATGATQ